MGTSSPTPPGAFTGEPPKFAPPTHVRYLVLAAGCSMALLAYVHRLAFATYAPEIQRDFGLDDQDVGNLMSAFLLFYALFQIPSGLAGDRLGARMLLSLSVLAWSVVTALIGLVPAGESGGGGAAGLFLKPLAILLLLRALFGAVQSGAFPIFTRVVADWMPLAERGTAQGALWTASRVGGAMVPPLAAWLLAVFGSWRVPLEMIAAVGLLWSAAFWYWFRNRPENAPGVNDAELALIGAGQPPADDRPRAVPWGRILSTPSVGFLCMMYGCCGPAGNFMLTLLPFYLRSGSHRALEPGVASRMFGLVLAGGFVACLLGGAVSDWLIRRTGSRKWGRRTNGLAALAVAGVSFAAVPFVRDVWLLGLLFCAAQFFNDFGMGPAWAACADVGERYAGTISGAMNMTSNITGAIGASLAGYLFASGKADWVFFVYGSLWIGAALCWLGIDVSKPVTLPSAENSTDVYSPEGSEP
jgi:sugar phosphate permease